ncbi:RpiB/LacA/LacB family sugar-phosphate isomerase [Acetobacteraceae bacterium]|nr:RpiB/LacA/LacB family sugar-phosphate isomerase [Candidatus Parcubacteria bacterium]
MKIYIASDHTGYELKEALVSFLSERGFAIEDMGAGQHEPEDDYPDYLMPLGAKVAGERGSFGIGIGASGQGEAMAVNRIKGARAAVYYGPTAHDQTDATGNKLDMLASVRAHNNANVLCLAARFISQAEAKRAVETWLATPFSGEERHVRRIAKLDN